MRHARIDEVIICEGQHITRHLYHGHGRIVLVVGNHSFDIGGWWCRMVNYLLMRPVPGAEWEGNDAL